MSVGRIASKLAGKLIRKRSKPKKPITTADSARKVEGKSMSDLTQPAGGSAGQTMDQADAGIRSSQRAARKATDFDRAIKKKKTSLNKYKKKRDSLKGIDKIKFIHVNQQRIKDLKASIADMERRGGPRVNRKKGGQVMKKAGGGKMSHVGLYPAEEARSGTMSEKKRAKHMKHGGKVHRNTSRENRLEELGRVDAEKAHTRKGKRNLKAEKKRIVKELNGNDFVASHYD